MDIGSYNILYATVNNRYQIYANNHRYWSLYNKKYGEFVERLTLDFLSFVNNFLIIYCVNNDWNLYWLLTLIIT